MRDTPTPEELAAIIINVRGPLAVAVPANESLFVRSYPTAWLLAAIADAIRAAEARGAAAMREQAAALAAPSGIAHLLPATPGQRDRQALVNEVSRRIEAGIRALPLAASPD